MRRLNEASVEGGNRGPAAYCMAGSTLTCASTRTHRHLQWPCEVWNGIAPFHTQTK